MLSFGDFTAQSVKDIFRYFTTRMDYRYKKTQNLTLISNPAIKLQFEGRSSLLYEGF